MTRKEIMARRIIAMDNVSDAVLKSGYFLVDNANGGTKKVSFEQLKKQIVGSGSYIVKTIDYGSSVVRVWSDGWFEQCGSVYGAVGDTTVDVFSAVTRVIYANATTSYGSRGDDNDYGVGCAYNSRSKKLRIYVYFNNGFGMNGGSVRYWEVRGFCDLSKI